jgi:hypothetical protein
MMNNTREKEIKIFLIILCTTFQSFNLNLILFIKRSSRAQSATTAVSRTEPTSVAQGTVSTSSSANQAATASEPKASDSAAAAAKPEVKTEAPKPSSGEDSSKSKIQLSDLQNILGNLSKL